VTSHRSNIGPHFLECNCKLVLPIICTFSIWFLNLVTLRLRAASMGHCSPEGIQRIFRGLKRNIVKVIIVSKSFKIPRNVKLNLPNRSSFRESAPHCKTTAQGWKTAAPITLFYKTSTSQNIKFTINDVKSGFCCNWGWSHSKMKNIYFIFSTVDYILRRFPLFFCLYLNRKRPNWPIFIRTCD
jgi:hypothetical protein